MYERLSITRPTDRMPRMKIIRGSVFMLERMFVATRKAATDCIVDDASSQCAASWKPPDAARR
jgi:hypothetical protein